MNSNLSKTNFLFELAERSGKIALMLIIVSLLSLLFGDLAQASGTGGYTVFLPYVDNGTGTSSNYQHTAANSGFVEIVDVPGTVDRCVIWLHDDLDNPVDVAVSMYGARRICAYTAGIGQALTFASYGKRVKPYQSFSTAFKTDRVVSVSPVFFETSRESDTLSHVVITHIDSGEAHTLYARSGVVKTLLITGKAYHIVKWHDSGLKNTRNISAILPYLKTY